MGQAMQVCSLSYLSALTFATVGFPFYPAHLYEPADPMVPVNILKMEEDARRKYKTTGAMYPVQFYDKQRSW
jgi:hypothetical protein